MGSELLFIGLQKCDRSSCLLEGPGGSMS
jgi:hypothetical protein